MNQTLVPLLFALFWAGAAPSIRDLDGVVRHPFAPRAKAAVLLFLATDCPISNRYVPEIQSLCGAYVSRRVECLVLYEDARVTPDKARAHRRDYGLRGVPAAVDDIRAIASAAGVTVTPEAVVVDGDGAIRYRGRIDDAYVSIARQRAAVKTRDLREAIDAVLAGRPVTHPRTDALGCYIAPPLGAAKEPS